MTDQQVESLAYSLQAWFQAAPKGLWLFDQSATGQKVIDLSGNGSNESSLTGTSIASVSVPVFNYGTGIWVPTLPKPSGGTDLTVTPGTPNVAWAGTTPALKLDRVTVPGTPNVTWSGSTPALVIDKTLTPGTPNVAWAGSTPGVVLDKTVTPGTPNVAWAGSTPSVLADKTLTPGTPVVAWAGSTPTLILEGAVTLTPGTANVDWAGSTANVIVTPDVVPEPPSQGGDGGDGFEDISTEDVFNLTLRPGVAVVRWSGSRAYVWAVPDLPRFRLPRRRRTEPVVEVPPPPPVLDLRLAPRAGSVAYAGSQPRLVIESFVPLEDYEAALAKIEELEREREEEAAVLLALSGG